MDGMRESPRLVRFLMDPAFAPFLEFEGFDEVGDIYGGSIDASFAQSAIEKLACRTNKGKTLKIFSHAEAAPCCGPANCPCACRDRGG